MVRRAFLKTTYRVEIVVSGESPHQSGGRWHQGNPCCPTCQIPLLLLWELDCRAPEFSPAAFGPLRRLPLFFCWGCVNDLGYQVDGDDQLQIFTNKRPHRGPSFPYKPYPEAFPSRGLRLTTGVPEAVKRLARKIIAEGQNDSDDEDAEVWFPSEAEQALLTRYFGHSTTSRFDLIHHQLGGLPIDPAWEEEFVCPNPGCRGTAINRLLGKKRAMKFLGGVLNDPPGGLPMIEPLTEQSANDWYHSVSVQFHICDCCYSIVACNRSD